jgi:hypothetical protein
VVTTMKDTAALELERKTNATLQAVTAVSAGVANSYYSASIVGVTDW